MHSFFAAAARRMDVLTACLLGCSACLASAAPVEITTNKEQARLQALLEQSIHTLTASDDTWLRVVTTPCFTKPAKIIETDFHLQRGQMFTSEPDPRVKTKFELQDLEPELARFAYVHRQYHAGSTTLLSEDRGQISLRYRQRPLFFRDEAAARAGALEALERSGVPFAQVDPERATLHLDRASCTRWSVRIPPRASEPSNTQQLATAGGTWIVRLDMTTGESTVVADD